MPAARLALALALASVLMAAAVGGFVAKTAADLLRPISAAVAASSR